MSIHNKLKHYLENSIYSFETLKEVILRELNDTVRYEATKVLYEKYPKESIPLIKDVLMRDFNYNFRILEFSKGRRYNVNDLLNSMIIRNHDKAQMASTIINNNLVPFALSWKDFSADFHIFYDLHLGVFILFHKGTETVAYLCSRANDPFHFIKESNVFFLSKLYLLKQVSKKALRPLIRLLGNLLSIHKKELTLAILDLKKKSGLPQYKLSSNDHEILLYFGCLK